MTKHLIVYGLLDRETPEATIANQKRMLEIFSRILQIQSNIRESARFMTPVLEIIDLFIDMDTRDSRTTIMDDLYRRYEDNPHG